VDDEEHGVDDEEHGGDDEDKTRRRYL